MKSTGNATPVSYAEVLRVLLQKFCCVLKAFVGGALERPESLGDLTVIEFVEC